MSKTGLVMEGGAMRGMFTAGVTDVMMEHGITFDGAIGVSAGAVFGCNYKSKQIGRTIRYNKRFCNDSRYSGLKSLFTTGNLYNADFAYRRLPDELDIFDTATYEANPMEFYVVCTDVATGKPVYHRCDTGDSEDITWMRASASMPMLSRPVNIGGYSMLDGGISDAVPLEYFMSIGYDRNVVILTQPAGYVKEKNKYLPVARLLLRHYPSIVSDIEDRHCRYNEMLRFIEEQERAGNAFVIRPPGKLDVGSRETDPEKLEAVYQIGRKTGEETVSDIKAFIENAAK